MDGLSWNILNEMFAEGKLCNIQQIINNGVSAVNKADFPVLSPKIWASIFTGKKVEKHGVIDFFSKEDDLRTEQIWNILNRQ
ncbi:MAG: alkaline phosphatase family protein, partial [Promethearchaeota archaeon]